MPNTDFFDDDLIKHREVSRRIKLDRADEPLETVGGDLQVGDEIPIRPVSDFNLTRMAKHKQEVNEQVAAAAQELERLRKRQEDLEQEKRDLEELRRKQEEFDRGKREMMERLNQTLVSLEKDELDTERLAELLGATRKRFKQMLEGLGIINDEAWAEDQIRDELAKALVVIDDARLEYNKAMAKIDAIAGENQKVSVETRAAMFDEGSRAPDLEKGFAYWIKVGLAVSLPLIVALAILMAVNVALHVGGVM